MSCTILRHTKILTAVCVRIISLATLASKNHTTNITKIVTQSIGIIIKLLSSPTRRSSDLSADEPREPASLTKLMTAYVVFRAIKEKDLTGSQMVSVSQKAW